MMESEIQNQQQFSEEFENLSIDYAFTLYLFDFFLQLRLKKKNSM